MRPLRRLPVAEPLHAGWRAGRWSEALPGVRGLPVELDVPQDTQLSLTPGH